MNTKLITIMLTLGSAGVASGAGIDIQQLPAAVRETINKSAAGTPVRQITSRQLRGKTVYEVELERRNAPNPVVLIDEAGQVVHEPVATTALPALYPEYAMPAVPPQPRLQLTQVPSPVRETIKRAAAGRQTVAIHAEEIDGRDAYAVQFRDRGRNPWIYIADDGSVLRPAEKQPMLIGTSFSDTPAPVQDTIRHEIGHGEIVDIDKEGGRGESSVYKVELKDDRGTFEIRVSEDGQLLENTRKASGPTKRE